MPRRWRAQALLQALPFAMHMLASSSVAASVAPVRAQVLLQALVLSLLSILTPMWSAMPPPGSKLGSDLHLVVILVVFTVVMHPSDTPRLFFSHTPRLIFCVCMYIRVCTCFKQIFWPVEPKFVGPFRIQGLFLTRQHAVAAEFALFLRQKVRVCVCHIV
jgi:hypothetical protein